MSALKREKTVSLKVLVACEFSGVVRDAFTAAGHDATSCDLQRPETPGVHVLGDVLDILDLGWDLIIAHPPCTYLASSGARWWPNRIEEQHDALTFVYRLTQADCPRIAIENPVGRLSAEFRKPDQIIQPWQFGHPEDRQRERSRTYAGIAAAMAAQWGNPVTSQIAPANFTLALAG